MPTLNLAHRDPPRRATRQLAARRLTVETLLLHARHLAPAEAALVHGVFERGLKSSELARAAGLPPRSVRIRLRRALDRLADPAFRFVVQHEAGWSAVRRAIARAVFLHGLTWREAAGAAGVTLHRVRREVDRIRTLVSAA